MSIIGGPLPKVNETKQKQFFPSEPSAFPSEQQINAFTKLIKDNPPGDKWQSAIKNIKTQYPEQLGDINPFSSDAIDKLSDTDFKEYTKRFEEYKKVIFPEVKAASLTSGMKIVTANPDKDNFFAETETAVSNFLKVATKVDNFALDLPGEIKSVAKMISGSSKSLISNISNSLADGMIGWVQTGLDGVASKIFNAFPKFNVALRKVIDAQSALIGPITGMFGSIDCLVGKVSDALTGSIEDMLTGMVKNSLNAPVCAVQQFVGAITGKITSMIDSIVSPFSNPLGGILGGGFKVKDIISKGANLLDKLKDPFGCKGKEPAPIATDSYVIDGGEKKSKSSFKQQGLLDKAFDAANGAVSQIEKVKGDLLGGIPSGLSKFEEEYGQWSIFGSKVSEAADQSIGTDCYTGNIFKCGAPKVEFFGGDGSGGAGKLLLGGFIDKLDVNDIYGDIKRTASIIGVEMTDRGNGYTEEPIVSFTDSCEQGYGAYGKAVIDKNVNSPTYGQIINVIMLSEGENYPVDIPAETDPVYIREVIVENPGKGYENATIEDECLVLNTKDGKVTGVEVNCQKPYTGLPKIVIKNPGSGAVLRPVMAITPKVVDQELQQVIDCVGTGGD